MQQRKNMYPFEFENSIDAGYMHTMYENDYVYIEKIFTVILNDFIEYQEVAYKKYLTEDLDGLRKVFHKLKATFGFIGMAEIEELCSLAEAKCSSAKSMNEIRQEIESLLQKIEHQRIIIGSEYERLKIFNLREY